MKTHYFQKKPMSMPHRPAVLPAAVSTAGHTRADIRRILRGPGLQAKLTIGAPDDVHEREADRVADAVMRMPDSHQQGEEETIRSRPLSDPITPLVQRQTEEEEEEPLQTKAAAGHTPEMTPQVASAIASMQEGGGQPLPPSERAFFEPRFGKDFSHVRIYTGAAAAESARRVRARAFTVGRDVVFGAGAYQPETASGQRLVAHELTHVVQQQDAQRRPANDALSRLPVTAFAGRFTETNRRIQRQPAGYPGWAEPAENYEIDYIEAKKLNDTYQKIFWGQLLGTVKHGLFGEWEEIWNRGDWDEFADRVASYQWIRGVKVDGALGAETWRRMIDLPFIYGWKTYTANGAPLQADNSCNAGPMTLGVDTSFYDTGRYGPSRMGSKTNGIELQAFIANHEAGYTYDMKRTIERSNWARTGAGPWMLMGSKSAGTTDDPNDDDEFPVPGDPPIRTPAGIGPSGDLHHLYSTDQPGLKPGTTSNPPTIMPTSTEAVKKTTFTESVEIKDPNGNMREDDYKWDWHSTTWLTKGPGGSWRVEAQTAIGNGSQAVGTAGP